MRDMTEQDKPIEERHPDIRELDPKDKVVDKRTINQSENAYAFNRDNPNWPLAVKTQRKHVPANLISSKQIRGIKYGTSSGS